MAPKPIEQTVIFSEFSASSAKPAAVRGHRSKGCVTCRKRKVKCDERRPVCLRCEKGYHKCLGYEKPLVFVAQEFSAPPKKTPSSRPANTADFTLHKLISFQSNSQTSSPDDEWCVILPAKKAWSPARRICKTMPLNAFKDEIVISHLLERFSIGLGSAANATTDAPTMAAVLTSYDSKSNAYISGLGLAEAFFGRVQKVTDLVDHSTELYGQALRNLSHDLQLVDKKAARSRAYMNLWSCVFLGLYEMVCSSNGLNWLQHSRGIGILMELLGPEAFQSPVANVILEMNRSFVATSYIVERKHCFLDRLEWKTVPWQGEMTYRSTISLMTDLLCDIPGLMEDADDISADEAQGFEVSVAQSTLQSKLVERIQRLSDLFWQWDMLNPLACWEMAPIQGHSVSFDANGNPMFDTVLFYDNIEVATDVVTFNAIRLLLSSLCDSAGLSDEFVSTIAGSQFDGPHPNPLLLPGQSDRISYALEICRSVDYLSTGSEESRGSLTLLFPLRIAYANLESIPRMSAWVGRILTQLSTSKGLQIGEHVLQLQSEPPISPKQYI